MSQPSTRFTKGGRDPHFVSSGPVHSPSTVQKRPLKGQPRCFGSVPVSLSTTPPSQRRSLDVPSILPPAMPRDFYQYPSSLHPTPPHPHAPTASPSSPRSSSYSPPFRQLDNFRGRQSRRPWPEIGGGRRSSSPPCQLASSFPTTSARHDTSRLWIVPDSKAVEWPTFQCHSHVALPTDLRRSSRRNLCATKPCPGLHSTFPRLDISSHK